MSSKPSRFKRFRNEHSELQNGTARIAAEEYMAPLTSFMSSDALPQDPTAVKCKDGPASKNPRVCLPVMMEEARDQGMAIPLDSSNKGFLLLQKKGGFSMGKGLGKDEQGIPEPLKVEVRDKKDVNVGIGVIAAKKRQQERKESRKVEWNQLREHMQNHFQSILSKNHAENKLKKDIKDAIKVIYRLDLQRGWFSHELSEILHELSKLREAGHDPLMYTSNPTFGEYIDDEGEDKDTTNEESGRKDALMRRIREATSIMDFVAEPYSDTLVDLLDLLRCEHNYCLYCGVEFEDQDDLTQNCPGFFEDDH